MKKRIISFLMVVVVLAATIPFADFLQLNIANAAGETITLDDGRVVMLPPGVPKSKQLYGKTYELNKELLVESGITSVSNLESGLAVYGTPKDVSGNEHKQGEWRYLGFDMVGNKYSNPDFPMDADSGRSPSQKNWIKMYDYGLAEKSKYYDDKQQCGQWLQSMVWVRDLDRGGKLPKNFDKIWLAEHFHILSPPGEYTAGLARGWHKTSSGKLWYETFVMPPEQKIEVQQGPSSVKADFILKDKIYEYQDTGYQDLSTAQNSYIEYEKLTVKKGSDTVFEIENNRNPNIRLKEGYYKFELYVKNSANQEDKKVKYINVIKQAVEAESEPIAVVNAPNTAPINTSFTVSAKGSMASTGAKIVNYEWFIGNSTSKLTHASKHDGKEEIKVEYSDLGFKYFQVKITDTAGKTARSNVAVTEISDNTPTDVSAWVDVPDIAYEGVYFDVNTARSIVYYGDESLSARKAVEEGIARYRYKLSTKHTGNLRANGGKIYVEELGEHDIQFTLRTKDAEDTAVDAFIVKPTPHVDYNIDGVKKINRKLVVDTTLSKEHNKYPIDESKTIIKIRDISAGQSFTINGEGRKINSEYIKTLEYENEKLPMTIKKVGNYEIMVIKEDTRGKTHSKTERLKITDDIAPIANMVGIDRLFRNSEGNANVEIEKKPTSTDFDIIGEQKLWYRLDKNKNNKLKDEEYILISSNKDVVNIDTRNVGEIEFKYYVKEKFDHIPEHVIESDFLSDTKIKKVKVDNIAPVTSFSVIQKVKTNILSLTDEAQFNTVMNKTEQLKESLQSNPGMLVDVTSDTKEVDTSNKVMEKIMSEKRISNSYASAFATASENTYVMLKDDKYLFYKFNAAEPFKTIERDRWEHYKLLKYYDESGKEKLTFLMTDDKDLVRIDLETGNEIWRKNIGKDISLGYIEVKENILTGKNSSYYIKINFENGNIIFNFDFPNDTNDSFFIDEVDGYIYYGKEDTRRTYTGKDKNLLIYKADSNNQTELVTKLRLKYSDYKKDSNLYRRKEMGELNAKYYKGKFYIFMSLNESIEIHDKRYYTTRNYMVRMKKNGEIEEYKLYDENKDDRYPYDHDYSGLNIVINEEGIFVLKGNGYEYIEKFDFNFNSIFKTGIYDLLSSYNYNGYNKDGYILVFRSDPYSRGDRIYEKISLKNGQVISRERMNDLPKEGIRIEKLGNDIQNRYFFMVRYKETIEGYPLGLSGASYLKVIDAETDYTYSRAGDSAHNILDAFVLDKNRLFLLNSLSRVYDKRTKTTNTDGCEKAGFPVSFYALSSDKKKVAFFIAPDPYYGGGYTDVETYKINKGFYATFMENVESTEFAGDKNYIPVVVNKKLELKEDEITDMINIAKQKKAQVIFLGNSKNEAIGKRLARETKGIFYTYTSVNDAFNKINAYIAADIGPKENNKTMYVKKGEQILYNKFYEDIEGDEEHKPSGEKWKYVQDTSYPHADGIVSYNNTWLDKAVTAINKAGRFFVSFIKRDNPPPNSDNYDSYRKWSKENPVEIIVYDKEKPPEVELEAKVDIDIQGDLRENHRVDFFITAMEGSKKLDMSSLDISFNKTDFLPNTKPNTLRFSRVFKTIGNHSITVKIKDESGKQYSNTASFNIAKDKAPTPGMTLIGNGKRDAEGLARFKINNVSAATDDPMGQVEYFVEDTKYTKDGESFIPNGTQYYPLEVEGNELVTSKLGRSNIKQKVTDFYVNGIGLNGEDLDKYRQFKTAEIIRTVNITNEAPDVEYTVLPKVIKVGNKVKHTVNITDDTIGGDYAEYKFIHDASYFTNNHGQHENNNKITTESLQTLDKKGKYDFYARAVDEDGAYSDWTFGGSVLACTEPAAAFELISEPAYNSGINTELKDDIFSSGSIVTVINRSFNEDYGSSVPNEGIKYLKLEYKDAAEEEYTTIFESDDIPAYIPTFNLPKIEERAVYDIKMTVGSPEGFYNTTEKQFTVLDLRMDAELKPNLIYASQGYKIKATLSKDGLGVTAYIPYLGAKDDPAAWVTLSKVREDATNKYYEAQINTEATLKDDIYDIEVFGMYPFNNEIEKILPLTVNTPIELKSDIKPDGPSEYVRVLKDNLDTNDYIELPAGEKIKIAAEIISPVVQKYMKAKLDGEEEIDLILNSETGKYEVLLNVPSVKPDKDYYTLTINTGTPNGNTAQNTHRVKLLTPINLVTGMPYDVIEDTTAVIKAETSKYVEHLTVKLFKGKPFEKTINMNPKLKGNSKEWTYNYEVPVGFPEGIYTAEFKAVTYNNNIDIKNESFKLQTLNLKDLRITHMVNHISYDGKYPILYNDPSVPVNYKTGYYVTFKINAQGDPDTVKMEISYPGYNEIFNMTKESQNGSDSVWRLDWYADPFTPKGTVINTVVTAEKESTFLNFNTKYNWKGDYLKVAGSIEGDVRIDQEY